MIITLITIRIQVAHKLIIINNTLYVVYCHRNASIDTAGKIYNENDQGHSKKYIFPLPLSNINYQNTIFNTLHTIIELYIRKSFRQSSSLSYEFIMSLYI